MKIKGTFSLLLCLSVATAVPALAGPSTMHTPMKSVTKKVVVEETPMPRPQAYWSISAGAVYRGFGDVDFSTGSRSAGYALPRLVPRGSSFGTGGAYEDGYVFPDAFTGPTGLTGYWGYDGDSQVSGDVLSFTGQIGRGSFSQSRDIDGGSGWSEDDNGGFGPFIETSYLIPLNENLRVGPQISFMWTSFDASETISNFRARQAGSAARYRVRDHYDVEGLTPLPDAPYGAPSTGPGRFLIPAEPFAQQRLATLSSSESVVEFYNRIQESLDVDVYTISLGGVIDYETDLLFFNGGLGLALNIVDWEASHQETLYARTSNGTREIKKWRDSSSDTELLAGFYLQAVAGVKISGPWYIGALGRYDWNEGLSGEVGPSSFRADLDGWTAGGVIGGRF